MGRSRAFRRPAGADSERSGFCAGVFPALAGGAAVQGAEGFVLATAARLPLRRTGLAKIPEAGRRAGESFAGTAQSGTDRDHPPHAQNRPAIPSFRSRRGTAVGLSRHFRHCIRQCGDHLLQLRARGAIGRQQHNDVAHRPGSTPRYTLRFHAAGGSTQYSALGDPPETEAVKLMRGLRTKKIDGN